MLRDADGDVVQRRSASYTFENGSIAGFGVASLLDEVPSRMTSPRIDKEVNVPGKVAFYSQYDCPGRRFFLNLTLNFWPRRGNALKDGKRRPL